MSVIWNRTRRHLACVLWKNSPLLLPLLLVALLLYHPKAVGQTQPTLESHSVLSTETSGDNRLDWFRQAKFGMFIHWGLYAVPGGEYGGNTNYAEWIWMRAGMPSDVYVGFAEHFNPVKFNAAEWAELARDSGMKYMVFTAKHHDGFCMYDSKYTEFDIVDATPYGKDVMRYLADACHAAGIQFCTYYSLVDWHHPEFPQRYSQVRDYAPKGFHGFPNPNADIQMYAEYLKNQVDEILSNYGPIGILWFDGGSSFLNYSREKLLNTPEIVKLIRAKQPDCLINNRLGDAFSDYGTPEQEIPDQQQKAPFEVCMTMTPNNHWGYNKTDSTFRNPKEIISKLVDIVGKGGNFLLNIAPAPDGTIPAKPATVLRTVGQWIGENHEAIYDTYASPAGNYHLQQGEMTWKSDQLFLHILNWPTDGNVVISGLRWDIERIYALKDKNRFFNFKQFDRMVFIDVPNEPLDSLNTVLVVQFVEGTDVYVDLF